MWSMNEENVLLDALEELVVRGTKTDNDFQNGYIIILEKWFSLKKNSLISESRVVLTSYQI